MRWGLHARQGPTKAQVTCSTVALAPGGTRVLCLSHPMGKVVLTMGVMHTRWCKKSLGMRRRSAKKLASHRARASGFIHEVINAAPGYTDEGSAPAEQDERQLHVRPTALT